MQETEQESEPDRTHDQLQRIPHDAQRYLGNVEGQSVGIHMEPTVDPDEPSCQAHEDTCPDRGKVYEPQRGEPKRLVRHGTVPFARTELEDYEEGEGEGDCDGCEE